MAVAAALLTALPAYRLCAQGDVDRLAFRFAAMTAVTGLEQAMGDSLLALLPGSTRDRAGNVTLTLGQGAPSPPRPRARCVDFTATTPGTGPRAPDTVTRCPSSC